MEQAKLKLLGYASGVAGSDTRVEAGPLKVKTALPAWNAYWKEILSPKGSDNKLDQMADLNTRLAKSVSASLQAGDAVCVIGGDHTSAIGTWSGVYDAYHKKGRVGLIWIDAHMDSHTPESSHSGNMHGMGLAVLLGQGSPALTDILHTKPKMLPEHVCLIGVRSYEPEELARLNSLGVRVYYIEEVKARGFDVVMKEAYDKVTRGTVGFGVTIDIDAFDPTDAPAVDVPEPNGLHLSDTLQSLTEVLHSPHCVAMEIVEFNPSKDHNDQTLHLMQTLLGLL